MEVEVQRSSAALTLLGTGQVVDGFRRDFVLDPASLLGVTSISMPGPRWRYGYPLLFLFVVNLFMPIVAQIRVDNLTHILPQCENVCTEFNVITTECNAVGIYDITYIYCECSPTNLQIILNCFDCQSVNETQEAIYQQLLDDVVDTCNDRVDAPDSTLTVSALSIVPSPSSSVSSTPNAGAKGHDPIPSFMLGGGTAAFGAAAGLLLLLGLP
uniref:Extracellular membrane protein CFEM domain-containing protein n=1 Tax=Mycena chlorophos TaxID=658473 RepID=A0ABQ0M1J7_MYCCL|nr:predicted protein [Mycena chlorophos]